ncbi:MAG: TonB-dependent receptor [Bacteroides sp.]|nr:TonB-dependent receptor [Bacteroides sp.]
MNEICRQTGISYVIRDGKQIILTEKKAANDTKTSRLVKGIVKDQTGEPMPGATVGIKGMPESRVMADLDGNFSIQAPEGTVLEVSYIGYEPKEVNIENNTQVDIVLDEENTLLDEIIVVGYGTQKKINKTGSVAQISSKELSGRPVQSLSAALQGLMPGVSATSSNGRPGSDGATIRIRGVGTLNSADPYILVDGVETGTLNSIDPNDVESISVLKDAASAAIYGSKASNGVILVTTKRGKEGATRVTYNANVGIQKPTNLIERMSSYDYARFYDELRVADGLSPRFTSEELQKFKDGTDPMYPNTDWYDAVLRDGFLFNNNVSISGGTGKASYMGSVGYMHQNGILPNSARRQLNARTNLDMKVSDRLTARLNLAFVQNSYSDPTTSFSGGSSAQIFRLANKMAPWIVARYPDGSYGTISDGNPVAWLDANETVDTRTQNFSGLFGLDYQLIDGLKATVNGSYVANNSHYVDFQKYIEYNSNKVSEANHRNESYSDWNRPTLEVLLNFDRNLNSHGIKALAGWHMEKYNFNTLSGYRKNFPNNDLQDMNAGDAASQTNSGYHRNLSLLSWFGRINYDYAEKYLFEVNFRADASSRFAKGHRWGYFPSLSAGWRISEESFMEGTRDWLQSLKIRGSWGKLGNQNALSDYYPWMNTYNIGAKYLFGDQIHTGYYQGSYKLETISWEKARTWGVGIDATIFQSLNISAEYYDRKTTGIIMDVPVPTEFGLGAYKDNVGALVNRGIELSVSYTRVWGDWRFGATANFNWNTNKLLELGGIDYQVDPNNKMMRREVGQPYHSYYMYKSERFFQSDEEAQAYMDKYAGKPGYPFGSKTFKGGDLIYEDTNGDGMITSDDRIIAGSSDPKFTYGLTLNGGWKMFDLSVVFSGAADVYSYLDADVPGEFFGDMAHPATLWLDAWTPENKDAKMPRRFLERNSPSRPADINSTFWLQNNSYLRMKNLQFGFTLPAGWLKGAAIQNLRIYYTGENLLTIGKTKFGTDPESSGASTYPLLRTHSFGLTVTF